ncbi:MAG: Lrp/AsnC family transcriptional regulator of ectoine degradation [Arenicella sp.]|jgi:Lrp/AsnC family transcriptional regulator of ectoine degradation
MSKHNLDAIDIRILSALQQCGRLSKLALAEKINLSPSPSWARFKKLEDAGFIKSYRAEIAIDKIREATRVIVTVSLKNHLKQDFEIFENHIQNIEDVVHCASTGGGFDYVMTLVCPSLSAFQSTMDKMVADEIGIKRYITYFVTREIKSSAPNLSKLNA